MMSIKKPKEEPPPASGRAEAVPCHQTQSVFPPPAPLKVKGDLAKNWKDWRQIWEAYEVVANLVEAPAQYRVATFVTCVGQDALKIYNSLQFPNQQSKSDMATILSLMERHCVCESNVIYDGYMFNRRDQEDSESFESYLTTLESLSVAVPLVQWRVNSYVTGLSVASGTSLCASSCFRRKPSR